MSVDGPVDIRKPLNSIGEMCFSVKHALPSRSDVEVTSEDDFGLLEELFGQTLDHVDDKKNDLNTEPEVPLSGRCSRSRN